MKKVIRIKESELRNKIYESVRQIISELDWRTYHSAGNKAMEISNDPLVDDDFEYWEQRGDNFYAAAEKAFKDKYGHNLSDVNWIPKYRRNDNFDRAEEEWNDYENGKTQYVKGKGWTKNESIIRRRVNECVNHMLYGK